MPEPLVDPREPDKAGKLGPMETGGEDFSNGRDTSRANPDCRRRRLARAATAHPATG